ncbi:hypothetical protein DFJ77DRAFT_34658 [Powellomyces hirtus]|nr:hypothetical protein DFJ77DRAFT_34658 [Powellomyces hirtus]
MARKAQQSSIKKRVPKQQKLNSRAAKKATTSSDQSDIEEDEHQSQGIADLLAGLQGQLSKKSAQQANKLLLEHEARLGNALEEVRSQATVLDEKRSDKIRSQKRKVEQASEQHGREVAKLTAEYKNAIGKWSHAIDLVDGHVDVVRRAEDECFLDMEGIGQSYLKLNDVRLLINQFWSQRAVVSRALLIFSSKCVMKWMLLKSRSMA